MPPYFATPYFHLSKLPISTKVALTCFCLMLTTAVLFVSLVIYAERTDWQVKKTQINFLGSEKFYGPNFQLDKIPPGEKIVATKSDREIYDIIHPHSFLMPVIFFVLCHLLEMTIIPATVRIITYIIMFMSMVITIFAPWLVTKNKDFAVLLVPSVAVITVSFLFINVITILNTWFIKPRSVKN